MTDNRIKDAQNAQILCAASPSGPALAISAPIQLLLTDNEVSATISINGENDHSKARVQARPGPAALSWVGMVAATLIAIAVFVSPAGMGRAGALGASAATYPEETRQAVHAVELHPDDQALALKTARKLIDDGRTQGDVQLVAGGYQIVERWAGPAGSTEAWKLAAIARQHLHGFNEALALLDKVLIEQPRDAESLLTRANINLVRGDLHAALVDCRHLAAARRFDLSILCDASVNMLRSGAASSGDRLQIVVRTGRMDPNLTGYAYSVLAEMAVFQNWTDQIQPNLDQALAADPGNLRIQMLAADHELALDDPGAALARTQLLPETDGILVRKAIAERATGAEEALARTRAILDRRFEANRRAGAIEHAREEARYYLDVVGDSERALERARANWTLQREHEDALLLVRAAAIGNAPEAAQPVRAWLEEQEVVAPLLRSALSELTP